MSDYDVSQMESELMRRGDIDSQIELAEEELEEEHGDTIEALLTSYNAILEDDSISEEDMDFHLYPIYTEIEAVKEEIMSQWDHESFGDDITYEGYEKLNNLY